MQIENNTFIVTGAASGLGAATARRIITRCGRVVIADVNPVGEALAKELGPNAAYVRCDVSSEQDGQAVIEAAQKAIRLAARACKLRGRRAQRARRGQKRTART